MVGLVTTSEKEASVPCSYGLLPYLSSGPSYRALENAVLSCTHGVFLCSEIKLHNTFSSGWSPFDDPLELSNSDQ